MPPVLPAWPRRFATSIACLLIFAIAPVPGGSKSNEPVRRSLAVREAPVRFVLFDVGREFRVSIALPHDLRGSVTVSLHDATLDQALTAILTPLGYTFVHKDGVIVVRKSSSAPVESTPSASMPIVVQLTHISPDRAAEVLRNLFPEAGIRIDRAAGAVIVTATSADGPSIRSVLQNLDVPNPKEPIVEAVTLRSSDAGRVAERLRGLFPRARFTVAGKQSLLIRAPPTDLAQIKSLIGTLDAPPQIAQQPLSPPSSTEAVKIVQGRPADIARAVAKQFPKISVGVSGAAVVLGGGPDDVGKAKTLIGQLDLPPVGTRITQIYRLRTVDAASVADLISRSFPDAQVVVDKDLNALSVTATVAQQQRIADAIAQLDGPTTQPGYNPVPGGITPGTTTGSSFEVVTLRSMIPSYGQGGYGGTEQTSPVIQTLQQLVPGVRVSALGTPGQLALIGDPVSLRLAKQFLAKIDVVPPLVVLDTEILEIDETTARNLGLLLSQPVISTTFSELAPIPDPTTGQSRLIKLGAITRTPLSLTAQLNLQIQRGAARVLADPRITTLSGRTATIRAGDTIGILTTVGGGVGTYTTTQLQNFQTGVTLDITPLVTPDNEVTVALHPVVNSLSGILNGVPQIATRDTQTTVHLKNNQTLIIGGLIQESSTRTENKIPILGDLPLVGSVFRNNQSNSTRNELIIVVTPHILVDAENPPAQGPPLPAIPTPRPLPTLAPGTRLPEPIGRLPATIKTSGVHATPSPSATPSALTTTVPAFAGVIASSSYKQNAVTYGQIPLSNVAGPNDAVSIFYVSISPALLANGSAVTVRAITTLNVIRASLSIGALNVSLAKTDEGQWAASFPFSTAYVVGQPWIQAGSEGLSRRRFVSDC